MLAHFTSLEFYWKPSWVQYGKLMETIKPDTFPNLQKLFLSVGSLPNNSGYIDTILNTERGYNHRDYFLNFSDTISLKFEGRLEHFAFAIPVSYFLKVMYDDDILPSESSSHNGQFLRTIPEHVSAGHTVNLGKFTYWIRAGLNDRPRANREFVWN